MAILHTPLRTACYKVEVNPIKPQDQWFVCVIVLARDEEMKRSKPPSTRRAEIQHLYQKYASDSTSLSARDLLQFLRNEQMEHTANEQIAEGLISRYEIEEAGK